MKSSPMPLMQVMGPIGMADITGNIQDMLSNVMPKQSKSQRLKVEDDREVFITEEAEKLIAMDSLCTYYINYECPKIYSKKELNIPENKNII